MGKISKVTKYPFVLAIILNFIPLLVYLVLGSGKFDSLDDYFMSSVLTGAYGGEYDVHLYFVNVLFGYVLRPFYLLFPTVGWYYIFEIAAAFISLSSITYVLLKKAGEKFGSLVALLVLVCVAPDFYFSMNFTQCAEILSAAGLLLLISGSYEHVKSWIGIGVALVVWGYMMRSNAFLLALPFAFSMLVFYALKRRFFSKDLIVAAICCCAAIWGVKKIDEMSYSDNEYRNYAAFQGPRATLGDGRYYDYDAAFSDLEERGYSGNNLRAGRNWMFYDTDLFSVSNIRPMMESIHRNRYEMNAGRTFVGVLLEFSRSLWSTNAWCWFLLGFLLTLCSKGFTRFSPWISLGLMAMCFGYLFYLNRIVHHVEVGIWLYGTVMLIPFVEKECFEKMVLPKRTNIAIGLFYLALFSYTIVSLPDVQSHLGKKGLDERQNDLGRFLAFVNEHQQDAFMLPFELYKSVGSFRNDNAFRSVQAGSWNNIFPLGYWNVYLPGMVRELDVRGISNPLRDLPRHGVYYVQERDALIFGPQSVWKEHYGSELVADTVQSFGKFDVLKFSVVGGNHEE